MRPAQLQHVGGRLGPNLQSWSSQKRFVPHFLYQGSLLFFFLNGLKNYLPKYNCIIGRNFHFPCDASAASVHRHLNTSAETELISIIGHVY